MCKSCADAGSAATDKFDEWAEPPKNHNAMLTFILRYTAIAINSLHAGLGNHLDAFLRPKLLFLWTKI